MVFDGPSDSPRRGTLMQRRHSILANNLLSMREMAFYFVYPPPFPHTLAIELVIADSACGN